MNVEMTKKNLLEAYCATPEYKAFKEADKAMKATPATKRNCREKE